MDSTFVLRRLGARSLPIVAPLVVGWALVLLWVSAVPAFERLRYERFPELEGRPVRQVLVFGNNHTESVVLLREMITAEGRPFSSEDLWHDWERLLDLGIFAELEVEAVPSGEGVLVVVSVYERPRWFVAPIVDYDVFDKEFTIGFRLRLRNYDGLNRSFRSKGLVGGRNRITASWLTPWIGSRRLPISCNFRLELPRAGGDELLTSGIELSTTHFLGDYKALRKGLTFRGGVERLDRDGTHPDGPIEEISPVVGVGFFRDSRNVRIDPTRGTFLSTGTNLVTTWRGEDLRYLRTFVDARGFQSIVGGTVLAVRGVSVVSNGSVPDYRLLAVGGGGSIRGQPGSAEVGENIVRASLEWRFPLLERRRFVIPIPLVPKSVSNIDLRIDGEFFIDSGTAWTDPADIGRVRIRSGAGVGLRIFLPLFELARIELAFDESGNPTLYFREGNLI